MTQLQNSAFKMKMASVPWVGNILPEPGAMVISEHDGHMYYADKWGWHRGDTEYSPVTLFIKFDGTNQFEFNFKAPVTSTITINDGDGTVTEVSGNDTTTVTHTTNYSEAGNYTLYVIGDVIDLTSIVINQGFVYGDVTGWNSLINLEAFTMQNTSVSGDISEWGAMTLLGTAVFNFSNVKGCFDNWPKFSLLTQFSILGSNIFGDVSKLPGILADNATAIQFHFTNSTFDSIVDTMPSTLGAFIGFDCYWTSRMVDDCLISLANSGVSGATINIAGNNQRRTSRSDAAVTTLEGAGNNLTVNE